MMEIIVRTKPRIVRNICSLRFPWTMISSRINSSVRVRHNATISKPKMVQSDGHPIKPFQTKMRISATNHWRRKFCSVNVCLADRMVSREKRWADEDCRESEEESTIEWSRFRRSLVRRKICFESSNLKRVENQILVLNRATKINLW